MRSARIAAVVAGLALAVVQPAVAQRTEDPPQSKPAGKSSDKLVYADFEGAEGGKAVSSRGGAVTLTSWSIGTSSILTSQATGSVATSGLNNVVVPAAAE